MTLSPAATTLSLSLALDLVISSGDKSSLLEFPDAWISKESDLDPSVPASLTPPPSRRTAYIGAVESPIPPISCGPPPPSCHTVALSRPELKFKEPKLTMHSSSKKAAGATPQSVLSPFDGGALNVSSTPLPPSVDTPPSLSPQQLSHQTSASSGSAFNWCTPTAEESCDQTLCRENPPPRRPIARLEVRNDVHRANGQGPAARESFTYACESLPYNAGLRPHAYVDNHKYATPGKRDLADDLYPTDEFTEEEDHAPDQSKSPKIFLRLVQRKKVSKLIAFSLPNSRKPPTRFSVDPRTINSQSLAISSPTAKFPDRYPRTTNHTTRPNHSPPPISPPPPYATISYQPTNVRSSVDSQF